MVKLVLLGLVGLVMIFLSTPPTMQSQFSELTHPADWRESLGLGPEKLSRLHFYFHDTVSGKKPSAVRVAQSATSTESPTLFGAVMIADDPLTEGPDPTSKLVGRAQGTYSSAAQEEVALLMVLNYCFSRGQHNGSCVSLLGRNRVFSPVREMPVVGGTGVFRFARGFALAKTHWFNATSGDAIVEYHVTVVHH